MPVEGAEDVARCLKCLMFKHEGCSLDLLEPTKMPGGQSGLEHRDRIPRAEISMLWVQVRDSVSMNNVYSRVHTRAPTDVNIRHTYTDTCSKNQLRKYHPERERHISYGLVSVKCPE